ncbi:FixH family protein [Myxococcota bacterium]|nr:FixH family protein [Myxococcota bacterium]MBU1431840.1 FixH family protein [Myxococcota bacterium]MBU1899350.1 FixH family protein [Myxococcota bacterium]
MKLKIHPWVLGIIVGFMVVVAVNATLIILGITHRPLLDAEDYYQDALKYQEVIDGRKAARALGWEVTYAFTDETLVLTVQDKQARPVVGLSGEVRMRRRDTRLLDKNSPLVERAPGVYHADRARQRGGIFDLHTELRLGDLRWRDDRQQNLP